MNVLVRAPRPDDASALASAQLDAGRYYASIDSDVFQIPEAEGLAEWFRPLLEPHLQEEVLSLVGEVEGEAVGYVYARLIEALESAKWQILRELGHRRVVVEALFVAESHRRRGVGTALMRAVESWARERGAILVSLDTYVASPLSIPFYERRLGYLRRSVIFQKVFDGQRDASGSELQPPERGGV